MRKFFNWLPLVKKILNQLPLVKKSLNRLRKFLNRFPLFLNRLPLVKKFLNRLRNFLYRLTSFLNRLPLVKKFLTRLLQFLNRSPLPSQVVPMIHTITYSPTGTNYIIFSIDKYIYIYIYIHKWCLYITISICRPYWKKSITNQNKTDLMMNNVWSSKVTTSQ